MRAAAAAASSSSTPDDGESSPFLSARLAFVPVGTFRDRQAAKVESPPAYGPLFEVRPSFGYAS